MINLLLSNILDVITIIVCLFITIRVGMVYPNVRSPRLLVLGLSMVVVTLCSVADIISSNITTLQAHTDWFLYIGVTVAMACILLSLLSDSNVYLERLIRIQVVATVLLLGLLLVSLALPDIPDGAAREILGSLRYVACTGISLVYITGFLRKQTRFGFLMSICFLLLAAGFLLDMQQYIIVSRAELFDSSGDICRLFGWILLLVAVLVG
jgi:hypothetical protein